MRIVLFGTSHPITRSCLEALYEAGHSILFVQNDIRFRSKLKRNLLRRWPPPERFARRHGIPVAWYRDDTIHALISSFDPDILCIASFKRLIPASLVDIARFGAINLHPSLLPRQRGPQTMFGIYHDGDAQTGLTIHRATPRFDAGPIVLQEAFPIPRGHPVEQLMSELVARAGPMLVKALRMIEAGAPEHDQDEAAATRGTRFDRVNFRVPLDRWTVEQSWHFLAGFCSRFRQPLTDTSGQPVRYSSVGAILCLEPTLAPGTAQPVEDGWLLHCNGGVIELRR